MQILGNRLLVLPELLEERTKGGIHLPANMISIANHGKIVAIGHTVPLDFLNKTILFKKGAASTLEFESQEYLLLFIHDIIAILDNK